MSDIPQYESGDRIGAWVVDHVVSYGTPMMLSVHDADDAEVRATLRMWPRSPAAEARRKTEARCLRSLDHESLPVMAETGIGPNVLYTVLEPLDGDTLSDRLHEEPTDWKLACHWLDQLAIALEFLHDEGWVHRTLNPDAVFVGRDDQVKLIDLSSAHRTREAPEEVAFTERNMTFVAPEVLENPQHHAVRADIYAFGCIAYQVLSGESPFPAAAWAGDDTPEQRLQEWKGRHQALDPGPHHPEWVRSLVRKCTHPLPEHRLPDMETVVAWLEAARPSWRAPKPKPQAASASGSLRLHPSINSDQLRHALAQQALVLQRERTTERLMVAMAAASGVAAGALISAATAMTVLLMEYDLLG